MPETRPFVEKFMRIANLVVQSDGKASDYGTGFSITKAEIHAVEAIGDHPGISVSDFARLRGISRSAASQIVARLKMKKLITQSMASGSDRDTSMKLSKAGEIAYRRHEAGHERLYRAMEARLGGLPRTAVDELAMLLDEIEELIAKGQRS
jgi:DNA-binding MarR family transcriptional regulator